METKELYFHIPRNVMTRFEIFPGVGIKQLIFGACGFLLAAGFWKLTGLISFPLPLRLFFTVLIFGLPVILSIPNPGLGNISLLDRLIKFYIFSKSQKTYFFRKGNKIDGY